jgi:hypothetical protein
VGKNRVINTTYIEVIKDMHARELVRRRSSMFGLHLGNELARLRQALKMRNHGGCLYVFQQCGVS